MRLEDQRIAGTDDIRQTDATGRRLSALAVRHDQNAVELVAVLGGMIDTRLEIGAAAPEPFELRLLLALLPHETVGLIDLSVERVEVESDALRQRPKFSVEQFERAIIDRSRLVHVHCDVGVVRSSAARESVRDPSRSSNRFVLAIHLLPRVASFSTARSSHELAKDVSPIHLVRDQRAEMSLHVLGHGTPLVAAVAVVDRFLQRFSQLTFDQLALAVGQVAHLTGLAVDRLAPDLVLVEASPFSQRLGESFSECLGHALGRVSFLHHLLDLVVVHQRGKIPLRGHLDGHLLDQRADLLEPLLFLLVHRRPSLRRRPLERLARNQTAIWQFFGVDHTVDRQICGPVPKDVRLHPSAGAVVVDQVVGFVLQQPQDVSIRQRSDEVRVPQERGPLVDDADASGGDNLSILRAVHRAVDPREKRLLHVEVDEPRTDIELVVLGHLLRRQLLLVTTQTVISSAVATGFVLYHPDLRPFQCFTSYITTVSHV